MSTLFLQSHDSVVKAILVNRFAAYMVQYLIAAYIYVDSAIYTIRSISAILATSKMHNQRSFLTPAYFCTSQLTFYFRVGEDSRHNFSNYWIL